MKIIKKGTRKRESILKTCGYCSTELEYNNSDIKHDFRDGNYIICPVCQRFLAISQTQQVDRSKDC